MSMTREELETMSHNLRLAIRRFPNCRIANCECDSKNGEWKPGCLCMCHWFKMDELHGERKWTLDMFYKQAKKGIENENV